MENNQILNKVFVMVVWLGALLALAACAPQKQAVTETPTPDAQVDSTPQATSTSAVPEAAGAESSHDPSSVSTEEYVSVTELFRLSVPTGWSTAEAFPGADFVMANSEAALERITNGSPMESGEIALKIGFLPLALLQEKQLAYLDFQFGAPPDVFLKSLLPMFQIGDQQAVDAAGDPTLITLPDSREAGLLTLSAEGREGMILLFEAGEGVLAVVSVVSFPGETTRFQELVNALAAEVLYSGPQDALYGVLLGG